MKEDEQTTSKERIKKETASWGIDILSSDIKREVENDEEKNGYGAIKNELSMSDNGIEIKDEKQQQEEEGSIISTPGIKQAMHEDMSEVSKKKVEILQEEVREFPDDE